MALNGFLISGLYIPDSLPYLFDQEQYKMLSILAKYISHVGWIRFQGIKSWRILFRDKKLIIQEKNYGMRFKNYKDYIMPFNIFSEEFKNRIIQTKILVPEELMILVCFEFGISLEQDLRYINNCLEGIGIYWNFSESDNGYEIILSHLHPRYYVLSSIDYNFFLKIAKYIKDDSFVLFRSYKNPDTMCRFYFKDKEFIIQTKLVDIFYDRYDRKDNLSWEDLEQEEVLRLIKDN